MANFAAGKTPDIVWHTSKVSRAERRALLRQSAVTLWFTGLSASGKSTLAYELERRLHDLGHVCFVLDGDNVRHGLSTDLGYDRESRKENIRRVAEVAKLFNDAGIAVITAFISPYRADRALARAILGDGRFIEAHLGADLAVCERRDPRGLYRKARVGQLPDFTGVSAPYEPPVAPELVVDTGQLTVEESIVVLLEATLARLRNEPMARGQDDDRIAVAELQKSVPGRNARKRGGSGAKPGRPAGKKAAKPKRKAAKRRAAPKYKDPQSGAMWSGRGLTPKWLAEKIKAGAKREEFLIKGK